MPLRMRVLLVGTGVRPIPPTGYGGVERTLAEFRTALEAAGHETVLVHEVRRERNLDEYLFARRLPAMLRSERWDVLHASTPVVANRLVGRRIPFVYTTHSRHWFEPGGLGGRWGLFLERRAARRAAHVVALTSRLATRIRTAAPRPEPAPLSVIPIGVDTERFRPDWGARTGRVAVGVGVVAPFKRWELAAAALRGTGVTLRILGPQPDPAYARTVVAAGDSVELLGEVPEDRLRDELARADLMIHPSRVELLAGAVLQGLASGLPVVAADPVAELIPPGAGAAAPAGLDGPALATALGTSARKFFDDGSLRRSAGETARAAAIDRYGWPAVVRAHEVVYRQVIDAGVTRRSGPST